MKNNLSRAAEIDEIQRKILARKPVIDVMYQNYPEEMDLLFSLVAKMQEANDEAFKGLDELKKLVYEMKKASV